MFSCYIPIARIVASVIAASSESVVYCTMPLLRTADAFLVVLPGISCLHLLRYLVSFTNATNFHELGAIDFHTVISLPVCLTI